MSSIQCFAKEYFISNFSTNRWDMCVHLLNFTYHIMSSNISGYRSKSLNTRSDQTNYFSKKVQRGLCWISKYFSIISFELCHWVLFSMSTFYKTLNFMTSLWDGLWIWYTCTNAQINPSNIDLLFLTKSSPQAQIAPLKLQGVAVWLNF